MTSTTHSPAGIPALLDKTIYAINDHLRRQSSAKAKGTDATALVRSLRVLSAWSESLSRNDPWMVAAVVGEFNAGKSSLINAMLGQRAAFTDPFEATATTAVYIAHNGPPYVELIEENGRAQRLSLSAFLDACRSKQLAHVQRADVYLSHVLPYRLVDTCGLGTVTQRNEQLAEMAVIQADVLIWVVDANDLFGNQETAFLGRCRATGMPLVVVLGKADIFSGAELSEVVGAIAERMQIQPSEVLAASPLKHSSIQPDAGVAALTTRLGQLSGDLGTTRKRSRRAKTIEARDEALRALSFVAHQLTEHRAGATAERAVLEAQAKTVTSRVAASCRSEVARHVRDRLCAEFSRILRDEDMPKLTQAAARTLDEAIADGNQRLRQLISEEVMSMWSRVMDEQEADAQNQLALTSKRPDGQEETIMHLRSKLAEIASRRTTVQRSANSEAADWLVGAFTALYILITRDVRPIPHLFNWLSERRSDELMVREEHAEYSTQECIEIICGAVVPDRVSRDLEPLIVEFVGRVVDRSTDEFCRGRAGCTARELDTVLSDVDQLADQLRSSDGGFDTSTTNKPLGG